jgi:hypothetical protein
LITKGENYMEKLLFGVSGLPIGSGQKDLTMLLALTI